MPEGCISIMLKPALYGSDLSSYRPHMMINTDMKSHHCKYPIKNVFKKTYWRRGQPTWQIGRELRRLRLVSPGPDTVRRWGGVDGPPLSRGSAADPWERRNPAKLPVEREATPGGAPRAGPVVRRGPRWTSRSRLEPERGRCSEVED
ncbi:hypothetical protein NDU88_003220 [Pleurodeles waltl]|uniref:Uncharacterized protein n=1 Tax=Pleurodeles waltl TaxID=8319 RepID=A0AAV7MPX4_PLEWA|nr:hypothetical protein NDU88_003220 [Pleurodeles waltl]